MSENERALFALYQAERQRLKGRSAPEGMYDAPVFGEGQAENPFLVLIGEAPGGEEAKQGRPFVGKAGQQLDALLLLASIPRTCVYITNTVKYRPVHIHNQRMRNRTPGTKEVRESLPLLAQELAILRPACIVTLGNVPLRAVLSLYNTEPLTIGEAHGRPIPLVNAAGKVTLFPLYHPASTIYNRALLPVCEDDIRALGALYAQSL